jgi:hypothetical protein
MIVRFDLVLQDAFSEQPGFGTMQSGGRAYRAYGYISPEGIHTSKDFAECSNALILNLGQRPA